MAILKRTVSEVLAARGLDEADLVAQVKAVADGFVASAKEHAALNGKEFKAVDVKITQGQIRTIAVNFLPDDLDGLADYVSEALLASVGEEKGKGLLPEAAIVP